MNSHAGRVRVGGVEHARRRINTSDSIRQSDQIVGVDSSAGSIILSLPNPSVVGATNTTGPISGVTITGPTSGTQTFVVQDEGGAAATNPITIGRNGTERINGVAADYIVNVAYKRVTLYTDGTDWYLS
jgi:hypothetical protein